MQLGPNYLAACLHFELRLLVVVWMYVCWGVAHSQMFFYMWHHIHPLLPPQHIQNFESAACCKGLFACLALPRQNKKDAA